MHFHSPIAFLLLLFLPLMLEQSILKKLLQMLGKRGPHSPSDAISFAGTSSLINVPQSIRARLRDRCLSIFRVLAFLLLVVALARPQYASSFVEIEASGRDIMLVLDTSGSMAAVDFTVDNRRSSRMEALKKEATEFVDNRLGDRIGLVVFGEQAFTQCPLTLDHSLIKDFIANLSVGMAGRATAIGTSLIIGLKRIKDIESESKVIILVTDGANNFGQVNPREAARLAQQLNVKIYTIGIGGSGRAPFPTKNIFGFDEIRMQTVEFDEATLKEIAEISGGKYFLAKDTEGLRGIYSEIDKLEERKENVFEHMEYEERFQMFLKLGFALLLCTEVLSGTLFRKIP